MNIADFSFMGVHISQLVNPVVILATMSLTFLTASFIKAFEVPAKIKKALVPLIPYVYGILMSVIFVQSEDWRGYILSALVYGIISVAAYDMIKAILPGGLSKLKGSTTSAIHKITKRPGGPPSGPPSQGH